MRKVRKQYVFVALLAVLGLILAACGSDSGSSSSSDETSGGSSGETVKVGILHSLSGTMAISEQTVINSELMAIDEINAAGGVLGKQIEPIVEDGASDWPTFAEKAEKLLTVDEVAAVFGGWTSACRKAMLPVFEGNNGLLFYPVQYEGLEASPNIFYTGATTNQQIIPALDYLKEQGITKVFLVGSDYVFPRTANKIIKAYAAENGMEIVGEEYMPLGDTNVSTIVSKIFDAQPDVVFNTLNGDSNVAFFKELAAKGNTPDQIQTISVSIAEEEVKGIGPSNIAGHLVVVELLPDDRQPGEQGVRRGLQGQVRRRHGDVGPDGSRLQRRLHLGRRRREGRVVRRRQGQGSGQGPRAGHARGPGHGQRLEPARLQDGPHRQGQRRGPHRRGLEVRARPIEPDPCLENYPWATGLAQGECDAQKAANGG